MGTTSKSEYTQLCTEILEAVGGSKNVKNVFHCITRLRIVPVNRDAVDMEKLSKVSGILKVVESSGQIQCVIGTTVPEVYEEFLAMSGVAAGGSVEAEPATDDVPEKKPKHHHPGSEYTGILCDARSVCHCGRRYDQRHRLSAHCDRSGIVQVGYHHRAQCCGRCTLLLYAVHHRLRSSKAVQGQGDLRHHELPVS